MTDIEHYSPRMDLISGLALFLEQQKGIFWDRLKKMWFYNTASKERIGEIIYNGCIDSSEYRWNKYLKRKDFDEYKHVSGVFFDDIDAYQVLKFLGRVYLLCPDNTISKFAELAKNTLANQIADKYIQEHNRSINYL